MAYIKNKSNYVLNKQHQLTNDGVVFERDMTTIGGVGGFGYGEVPIYNSGNFVITINESKPIASENNTSDWVKNNDSNEWTLNDLVPYVEENLNSTKQLKDVYDMRDFAYYGSCTELIRVSINNILSTFPGELYVPYDLLDKSNGVEYIYTQDGKEEQLMEKVVFQYNSTYVRFDLKYVIENPFNIDIHEEINNKWYSD